MASGKSTVSRRLQVVTNRPAVSLDQMIAEKTGVSVAGIFVARGEAVFRELEVAALAELDTRRPLVVDTGGGIVQSRAAVRRLRRHGVVIWLDASWATVRARLQESDESARPLIEHLGWVGLEDLFRDRRRLYAAAADFRLRSDRATADEIVQRAMLRSLHWERRREVNHP